MPNLYAQPYNTSAYGFYFDAVELFNEKAAAHVDAHGSPVEEYEIQFIDGSAIEQSLFEAWDVDQSNLSAYFEAVNLERHEQLAQIALARSGYCLNEHCPIEDVVIYYVCSMRDLAIRFVEEGLYGQVPYALIYYIDYDAIARDLEMEYTHLRIGSEDIVFSCP